MEQNQMHWNNIKTFVSGEILKRVPLDYKATALLDARLNDELNEKAIQVVAHMRDTEEKVIVKALTSLLGREPTINDAKKTARAYYVNRNDIYDLFYDSINLGTVEYLYGSADSFLMRMPISISFKPALSKN